MVQETAQMRLERALASKTRLAIQQLELEPGQLVAFWRKPATKDDSGWRGPATIIEVGPPAVVQWQGSHVIDGAQDLRRALVYLVFLGMRFADPDCEGRFLSAQYFRRQYAWRVNPMRLGAANGVRRCG